MKCSVPGPASLLKSFLEDFKRYLMSSNANELPD
jgi:hypothetical protein